MAKSRCAGAGSVAADEIINRLGAAATKGLRDVFHRSKDATFAFTARVAINTKLRSIGQMTELSIDTNKKRVRARLELLGTTYITIEEATSSREWVTVALSEFVVGQDFALPAKAGALLKLLT